MESVGLKEVQEHQKTINAAAYGNNTYVVVGELGTIITSPDGTTWTERDSGNSNYLRGITFSR